MQVIGTSCGSTENPVVPAPLPDAEEFAREVCELIRDERSRESAGNVDPDRIIFTTQDEALTRVFIEIQTLVISQCGPGQERGACLGELFALLIFLDDPAQAAAFIRDLLAEGVTWTFIRKHMGIRRDKRLGALCADAGQSIDEYAREHYCRLFLRRAEEALSKALRNASISSETASNAVAELAKAANKIPFLGNNERMKQIERVRRHRARKRRMRK